MKIGKQLQVEQLKNEIYEKGLDYIMEYLWSDKFCGESIDSKMVNREDISLRIAEIKNLVWEVDCNKDTIARDLEKEKG